MISVHLLAALLLVAACRPLPDEAAVAVNVPFTLSETKHIVIRAKINGRGPYSFIMDTGSPALFIPPAVAVKCDVDPARTGWAVVKDFEIEGGAHATNVRARIEEPMQVSRMNSLGVAGMHLDGIIGYNVIARFRVELDMRRPAMKWTPLTAHVPEPPDIKTLTGGKPLNVPKSAREMEDLAKMASALLPKKAETRTELRGFLGLELSDWSGEVRVLRVLAGGPAEKAGVKTGDTLLSMSIAGESAQPVRNAAQALRVAEKTAPDASVTIKLKRGTQTVELTARASGGSI